GEGGAGEGVSGAVQLVGHGGDQAAACASSGAHHAAEARPAVQDPGAAQSVEADGKRPLSCRAAEGLQGLLPRDHCRRGRPGQGLGVQAPGPPMAGAARRDPRSPPPAHRGPLLGSSGWLQSKPPPEPHPAAQTRARGPHVPRHRGEPPSPNDDAAQARRKLTDGAQDSVTLEEIESAAGFVAHMDRLELPNQLVAVLADPLLQKLLLLRPGAEAHRRVANWLGAVLRHVLDGDADEGTLWDVLEVVRDFVVRNKTLPPVLLGFFARFFELWSGSGRRDLVFGVLGYAPFHDFQALYTHVFQPLEAAVQDNEPDTQLALLALYTTLLHHWTAVLRSSTPLPSHASASITALVRHVNLLALTLLQTRPGVGTESAVLAFYEQSVRLVTHAQLAPYVRIELPPAPLVYGFLFSGSLATLSRLCAVLAAYKRGFETAMATRAAARHHGAGAAGPRIDALAYDRAYVNTYNGFLMDMCNCFWRARAFSDADADARGCMLPRATVAALADYVPAVDRAFALASLFSLSHAPALCLQSIRRVRELEDAAASAGGD
ncbi:Centromere protein I, partial [Tolypocladium paradoxum]